RDGVALDRLALERVAGRGPVAQVAGLEVEVERLAVGADRADAVRRVGGEKGKGKLRQDDDQGGSEKSHGVWRWMEGRATLVETTLLRGREITKSSHAKPRRRKERREATSLCLSLRL